MQEELKYRTHKVLGYNSDLELLRHYIYSKLTTEDGRQEIQHAILYGRGKGDPHNVNHCNNNITLKDTKTDKIYEGKNTYAQLTLAKKYHNKERKLPDRTR
ncbi:hypothetical protein NOVO_00835 [Rickettsiales bacterium Ac37b]|nr:hypothetical protein NOVO_00835 [Rickettsiales bacterium Ac37b]